MRANIAFYVHHHGSGHVMRALALSRALDSCDVTFLGSGLEPYSALIPPEIRCIRLPADTPAAHDHYYTDPRGLDCLHYAPLNIGGLRKRNAMLTAFFEKTFPLLLIVDVSVETALLARLCGVPTIVVRQHGRRDDAAHRAAYQSASALLAPYPRAMERPEPDWLRNKTIYTGGFSRYAIGDRGGLEEDDKTVVIMTGTGGTSIDHAFAFHIAGACPGWTFRILGLEHPDGTELPGNLRFLGKVPEPLPILQRARVVIGNTGHNTVMEMASLGKRFITVPEARPFDEQQEKAGLLAESGLALVVNPGALYSTDWAGLLQTASGGAADWPGVIDPGALEHAAGGILSVYRGVFGGAV